MSARRTFLVASRPSSASSMDGGKEQEQKPGPLFSVSGSSRSRRHASPDVVAAPSFGRTVSAEGERQYIKRRTSFAFRPNFSKYAAAVAMVKSSEEKSISFEDYRVRAKKFMANSTFGRAYERIILLLSLASGIQFIFQTYIRSSESHTFWLNKQIEAGFAGIFAIDWLLKLLLSDHTLNFLITFDSIVDILVVGSIASTYLFDKVHADEVDDVLSVVLFILFGVKTTRIARVMQCRHVLANIEDPVESLVAKIFVVITVMLFFFAAVMQYLEEAAQSYQYHTWCYYIWVTMSTVGYGDITPSTTRGRIAAMVMVILAIISIPSMTNELIEKMKLQSVYARTSYVPKSVRHKHVLIVGDVSSTSLIEFFDELFHEDHDNNNLVVVMMMPVAPSYSIIFMTQQPKFQSRVHYLEGSAMLSADLARAKTELASAIFIVTDKFTSNPDEADAKTILLNLSIKRYLSYFYRREVLYCMQLIRPENRRHISRSDGDELPDNELVVCLNEIKMGAMAKAVLYPGANTLLMGLLSSFSDDALPDDDGSRLPNQILLQLSDKKMVSVSPNAWIKEYNKGCDWEIYVTELSEVFAGAKFVDLSYALYDKIGVVLFALQITDTENAYEKVLLLNPAQYVIPEQTRYRLEAFVIAKNKVSSDLSFKNDSTRKHSAHQIQANLGMIAAHIMTGLADHKHGAVERKGSKSARRTSTFMITRMRNRNTIAKNEHDATGDGAKNGTVEPVIMEEENQDMRKSRWDALKRSSLIKSRVSSHTFQEIFYQLEDENFVKNYYSRSFPADIEEVTIKTNILEEMPFINQHLIIIGQDFHNIYDFIRPLRARHLGPLRYIVLLCEEDLPYSIWQRISVFDAIMIVRGSPLEESNLRRAGIFRAAQVVIFTDEKSITRSRTAQSYSDTDTIFATQHVRRMNPKVHIVVEVVSEAHVSYFDDEYQSSRVKDFRFSPQYASGHLFASSLLDSIVCQAYYNPHVIKVLQKLLAGKEQVDRIDLMVEASRKAMQFNESDAEENVNSPMSSKRRSTFVRSRSTLSNTQGSCLYQMQVPEAMVGKTYGDLFQHLAYQGIIPLGLLRGLPSGSTYGPKGNKMPYVYTNPDKVTELYSCDRVFVLSTQPVKVEQKMGIRDWLLSLQQKQSLERTSVQRSASPPTSATPLDMNFRHLHDRINRMANEVGKRVDNIFAMLDKAGRKQASSSESDESSSDEAKHEEENEEKNADVLSPMLPLSSHTILEEDEADLSSVVHDHGSLTKNNSHVDLNDFEEKQSEDRTDEEERIANPDEEVINKEDMEESRHEPVPASAEEGKADAVNNVDDEAVINQFAREGTDVRYFDSGMALEDCKEEPRHEAMISGETNLVAAKDANYLEDQAEHLSLVSAVTDCPQPSVESRSVKDLAHATSPVSSNPPNSVLATGTKPVISGPPIDVVHSIGKRLQKRKTGQGQGQGEEEAAPSHSPARSGAAPVVGPRVDALLPHLRLNGYVSPSNRR